jgi:hypothetical protein
MLNNGDGTSMLSVGQVLLGPYKGYIPGLTIKNTMRLRSLLHRIMLLDEHPPQTCYEYVGITFIKTQYL